MTLKDIGEGGDSALLCLTDQPACCRPPYTGSIGSAIGNWYFPSRTVVPSDAVNDTSGLQRDLYITRGQMVVRMHRRRGGVTGIYSCERPNAVNITQAIYIGVYTDSTGECNHIQWNLYNVDTIGAV